MNRTSLAPREGEFDWLHFVARSGAEGCRWVRSYQPFEPLEGLSIFALRALRDGDLDKGRALLRQLEGDLEAATEMPLSVRHVLERWHCGVQGYDHYRRDELDRAEASMIAADRAVVAAIERDRFLLPLANHCHEFILHRARIARNRHRWSEMSTHIEICRRMMDDRAPLCGLSDGTLVFFTDLVEHYRSMGLTAAESAWLADLLDENRRRVLFERFVHALIVPTGPGIPYP